MENKAITVQGYIAFSTWITAYSGYLELMVEKAREHNLSGAGNIHFNGDAGSTKTDHKTVKLYFDLLHNCPNLQLGWLDIVKLLKFLHSDGKIIHEFEKKLQNYCVEKLLSMDRQADTKLLTSIVLSQFDSPDWQFFEVFKLLKN